MTPQRIQRSRAKGWRMPEGAVYVGRPSRWGNPYRVESGLSAAECVEFYRDWVLHVGGPVRERLDLRIAELRGKDLVCWCSLDQPCHADVLLELANR